MVLEHKWQTDWNSFIQTVAQRVDDGADQEQVRDEFCGRTLEWQGLVQEIRWENDACLVDIKLPTVPAKLDKLQFQIAQLALTAKGEQKDLWSGVEKGNIVAFSTELAGKEHFFPGIRLSLSDRFYVSFNTIHAEFLGFVNPTPGSKEEQQWADLRALMIIEEQRQIKESIARARWAGLTREDPPEEEASVSPNTPVLRPPTKAERIQIDFSKIEEQLDIVVPNIYRMFIEAAIVKQCNLPLYGIYHTTETIIKANEMFRLHLADAKPPWKNHYLDFGVGDGVGNHFFLHAKNEDDDLVELWSHDPAGIEKVSSATKFLKQVLGELECGFTGPNHDRFEGNGPFAK